MQIHCSPFKLDWVQLNFKKEIQKIQKDNAVYMEFPNTKETNKPANNVVLYGDTLVYLNRAQRQFHHLVRLSFCLL